MLSRTTRVVSSSTWRAWTLASPAGPVSIQNAVAAIQELPIMAVYLAAAVFIVPLVWPF